MIKALSLTTFFSQALVLGFLILMSVSLLYFVGFSDRVFLHDAAHDVRHAFTLPCH